MGLDQFFEFMVGFSVCFCIVNYFLNFFFVQIRRCFDSDFLFFIVIFIFCGDVQDIVSIDIEGDFDLWYIVWCWVDVIQVELIQRFVIRCMFMFILQYMDGYCRLVVFCSREYLVVFGWDGGVFGDKWSYYVIYCFDIQRQWGNVQQQYVFYIIG